MAINFDSAERSQAQSRRVILYTITTSEAIYRVTTHAADVVYGGQTFSALTVGHDDEQISQDASGDELVIHLPISHPLVQRFAATGIPEQSVQVLVQELQSTAGIAAQTWSGPGQSMTINGTLAALRVPTTTNDAFRIQLPFLVAQKLCPHVLFESNCAPFPGGTFPAGSATGTGGPKESDFTSTVHVASISTDGLTIVMLETFSSSVFPFGKMIAGSETRTIVDQPATTGTFTVDMPFVNLVVGQAVQVIQGCDRLVATCKNKFSNVANHGSYPQLNSSVNYWSPTGLGIQS